jgi:hypothetical protein
MPPGTVRRFVNAYYFFIHLCQGGPVSLRSPKVLLGMDIEPEPQCGVYPAPLFIPKSPKYAS